ncbi:hypothetical protein TNCV_4703151 [Trichonephila clavipes]|nr:hypothetical protein TNCV_4703151 [Trichonephila clavipes]
MAGCNSVIENRKLKEDIAKHANKNIWAAGDGKQNKPKPFPVADSCCSSKTRLTPLTFNKFYGQGDAESRGSYDIDDRKRIDSKNIDHDCCIYHDGCSKDLQHFLTYQMPSKLREPSFGLRRSYSLELRPPYLEDRSWTTGRKKCPMRPSTAPEEVGGCQWREQGWGLEVQAGTSAWTNWAWAQGLCHNEGLVSFSIQP